MNEAPSIGDVRDILGGMQRRCHAARMQGGVAAIDVLDKRIAVPAGWTFDRLTSYYVPHPHLLDRHEARK